MTCDKPSNERRIEVGSQLQPSPELAGPTASSTTTLLLSKRIEMMENDGLGLETTRQVWKK